MVFHSACKRQHISLCDLCWETDQDANELEKTLHQKRQIRPGNKLLIQMFVLHHADFQYPGHRAQHGPLEFPIQSRLVYSLPHSLRQYHPNFNES